MKMPTECRNGPELLLGKVFYYKTSSNKYKQNNGFKLFFIEYRVKPKNLARAKMHFQQFFDLPEIAA